MVAGRNNMSSLLHPSPSAQGNLVIFALGLEPAHLLPYFKYLLQNSPAVSLQGRSLGRQGSGLSRLVPSQSTRIEGSFELCNQSEKETVHSIAGIVLNRGIEE